LDKLKFNIPEIMADLKEDLKEILEDDYFLRQYIENYWYLTGEDDFFNVVSGFFRSCI
jgi:hypothetical protein